MKTDETAVAARHEHADGSAWWKSVGFALLLGALSVYEYFDLTAFEEEGGYRRMNRILAFAYELVGKWGVCVLLALASIAFLYIGIREFRAKGSRRVTGGR